METSNANSNHPRRYAHDPEDYPLGVNDLDMIGTFTAATDNDMTNMATRWMQILYYHEAEVRALKRQLKADREAATTPVKP